MYRIVKEHRTSGEKVTLVDGLPGRGPKQMARIREERIRQDIKHGHGGWLVYAEPAK